MSTGQPHPQPSQQLVRVQVVETVEQVNARGPMTAKEFEIFASDNGRCELIGGSVKMMSPAGSEHGYIAAEILYLLSSHVRQYKLGRVYAAETGFILQQSPTRCGHPTRHSSPKHACQRRNRKDLAVSFPTWSSKWFRLPTMPMKCWKKPKCGSTRVSAVLSTFTPRRKPRRLIVHEIGVTSFKQTTSLI